MVEQKIEKKVTERLEQVLGDAGISNIQVVGSI